MLEEVRDLLAHDLRQIAIAAHVRIERRQRVNRHRDDLQPGRPDRGARSLVRWILHGHTPGAGPMEDVAHECESLREAVADHDPLRVRLGPAHPVEVCGEGEADLRDATLALPALIAADVWRTMPFVALLWSLAISASVLALLLVSDPRLLNLKKARGEVRELERKIAETELKNPLVIDPEPQDPGALARQILAHRGDILLHKRALEMCEYIKTRFPHIYLYTSTNGLAFTEEQDELLGLLAPMREDIVEIESPETGTPLPETYQAAPALLR